MLLTQVAITEHVRQPTKMPEPRGGIGKPTLTDTKILFNSVIGGDCQTGGKLNYIVLSIIV